MFKEPDDVFGVSSTAHSAWQMRASIPQRNDVEGQTPYRLVVRLILSQVMNANYHPSPLTTHYNPFVALASYAL